MMVVVAAVVVAYLSVRLRSRLWALGLGLLMAGVLGNLTDRLFRAPGPMRGEVIDFLMLPNWPVFNVADMAINGAAALILVHNHPSGNPEPSRADIAVTLKIAEAGRLLGIAVHDHVIIGQGRYVSLKAKGLI